MGAEAGTKEASVAQEELDLMEERNRIEDILEKLRAESSELEMKAAALGEECEKCSKELKVVEHEHEQLAGDESLLREIENRIGPVHRSLEEKERFVANEEVDLRAREADCDEREARLLPEYRCSSESLALAEETLRELHSREEESQNQRLRLLERQRDLDGDKIRLNGLEGALQRHSNSVAIHSGSFKAENLQLGSEEEMRRRLFQLRHADADWAERARLQQREIERLEAEIKVLKADRDDTVAEVEEISLSKELHSASHSGLVPKHGSAFSAWGADIERQRRPGQEVR